MLGDGLAEGAPVLGISNSGLEGCLGYTKSSGSYVDAPSLQTGHYVGETPPLYTSHQVRSRNTEILKNELGGIYASVAQLFDLLAYEESSAALFYDKATHAFVGRVGPGVSLGEQSVGVAVGTVGHEHLGAIDDVLVAVFNCDSPYTLEVASALGLSEADPTTSLPRSDGGEEPMFLLVGAESGYDMGHDGMAAQGAAKAHPTFTQLLNDHRKGNVVQTQPAILFWCQGPEEAQPLHRLHQGGGVLVGVVVVGGHRKHVPIDEVSDGAHHLLLLLCNF